MVSSIALTVMEFNALNRVRDRHFRLAGLYAFVHDLALKMNDVVISQ